MSTSAQSVSTRRTRFAVLWMHASSAPLLALRSALSSFILYTELNASAFQIGLCHAIRPIMALFSFYWGANLSSSRDRLLPNLIGAWVFARLPFVFLPFISNGWYLLFCEAAFHLFYRGSIPAMMEILHINMDKKQQNKSMAISFALQFLEGILLGLLFVIFLTKSASSWKILYALSALIGLSSVLLQKNIHLPHKPKTANPQSKTFKKRIIDPWITCIQLIKDRPDFAQFQMGFMIGGFSLMLISPAITIFSAKNLQVTSANMAMARNVLVGLGVLISISLWQQKLTRAPTKLLSIVITGFALYSFTLLLSQFNSALFYLAFLIYGIAQAGSHLLWHLSGTIFAQSDSSSKYTTVSILLIGIRGLIGPALGAALCPLIGPQNVIILGTLLLSFGAWKMTSYAPKHPHQLKS